MANKYTYEDNKNDIIFRSVKKPQLEFQDIIGRKDRLSFNNNSNRVSEINDNKPFINAVDIDWNEAEVRGKKISTTGDLLKLIEEGTSQNNQNIENEIENAVNNSMLGVSYTISAFRWYHPGYTPKVPIKRSGSENDKSQPYASDDYGVDGYPIDYWSNIVMNRPSSGDWVLWCSYAKKTLINPYSADYEIGKWSTPVCLSGIQGTPGEDSKSREYIYQAFSEEKTNFIEYNPNFEYNNSDKFQKDDYVPKTKGWSDSPIGISDENKFEYVCYRDYKDEAWTPFSNPILWSSWGRVGIDGDGVEYVFVGTSSYVSHPQFIPNEPYIDYSTGKTINPTDDEYLPTVIIYDEDNNSSYKRCTDDPPELSKNIPYIWVGKRRKTEPDENGERIWNDYEGQMSLWAKWGFDGKDGSNDIYIDDKGNLIINGKNYGLIDKGDTGIGIINGNPCEIESHPIGTVVYYNGNIYVYTGDNNDNTLGCSGWKSIGESTGNGKYLHVAYAIDIQFNISKIKGFTVNPQNLSNYNFEWIGLCTTDNDTDPGHSITFDSNSYIPINNGIEKYKWNRIGGQDGNGAEWVYIRTKVNIPPTVRNTNVLNSDIGIIENPNNIAINGNRNESEFYPLVGNIDSFIYSEGEANNTIESNRWADDAGGPTPEWPFRWRVQRKFINGEWQDFGTVCTDGNYISSSGFKLTTDNDTIIIDDDSTAESIQNVSVTKLYLWDGNVNIIDDSSRISVDVKITHSNSSYNGVIIPQYHVISNDSWVSCSEWGELISLSGIDKFRLTKSDNSTLSVGADNITYTIKATGTNDNITTSIVQSFQVVDISDGINYSLQVTPNTLPVHHNGTNYVYSDESTINISAIASSTNGVEQQTLNNNNPSIGDLYVEIKASTNDLINVSGSSTSLTVQLPDKLIIESTNKHIVDTIKYFNINLYYKTGQNSGILVDTETIDFSIKGDKGTQGSQGPQGPQGPAGESLKQYLVCSPNIINFNPNMVGDTIWSRTINVKLVRTDNSDNSTLYIYRKLLGNGLNSIYYKIQGTIINDEFNTVIQYDDQDGFNVEFNGVSINSSVQNLTGIDFRLCKSENSEDFVHNVTVPIIYDGLNGSAIGANGYSQAIVRLYSRNNTIGSGSGISCYYNFSDGKIYSDSGLSQELTEIMFGSNTWTTYIPSASGENTQLYMIAATAYSNTGSDSINYNEWSSPVAVGEDGKTAVPNIKTIFLYCRQINSDSVPNIPSRTVKYIFSDNKILYLSQTDPPEWTELTASESINNVWKIFDSGEGKYLYFTHATAVSTTNEDIINVTEWSTPQLLSVNGTNGTNGANGKMFFSMGEYNSSINYREYYDDYRIPMVFYDDGEWNDALNMNGSYYYINPEIPVGTTILNQTPGKSTTSGGKQYWLKASNFGVVMAQGIFSDFAKIGAGLISGDYLFTSNGTIRGYSYNDGSHYDGENTPPYMRFDSKFPDGKQNEQDIKLLYNLNANPWANNNNSLIITEPFYIVEGVSYKFIFEKTTSSYNVGSQTFGYDLAYEFWTTNNVHYEGISNLYSNGEQKSIIFNNSGYYIIKANPVKQKVSQNGTIIDSEDNYVTSCIQPIRIDISDQQQPLFVPNWWVDLKTGKMNAAKGNFIVDSNGNVSMNGGKIEFKDNQAKFYGNSGIANIIFGIDNTGCSVLQFYNNNGQYLYDLGPKGLELKINSNSGFTEITKLGKFDNFNQNLNYQLLHEAINSISNFGVSSVYQYKAGSISLQNGTIIEEGSSNSNNNKLSFSNDISNIDNHTWLDTGWYFGESKESYLNNGIFIRQYVYITDSKINKGGYIYYTVQNGQVTLYNDEYKTRRYGIPSSGGSILEIIGETLPRD